MRIALTQMDQKWEDKEGNLLTCEVLIHEAKNNGADLIVFPEMTLTGFSMNYPAVAEEKESKNLEKFKKLAKYNDIAIIFGLVIKNEKFGTNSAIFLSREGEVLKTYNKIHPFSIAGEDENIKGGESLCIVENLNLRIGITICYDLRFPELYSALSQYCDLVVNIANWPAKRQDHWFSLIKARSIENQTYVAGINRIGVDGKSIEYKKSSVLVNPNGDVVSPLLENENFSIYEIDQNMVRKFRDSFSTVQDRRPNLYKSLL
jgi:omega-amidase